MKYALILFTRVPEEGTTKTRLAVDTSPLTAKNVQIALLRDLVSELVHSQLINKTFFFIEPYEKKTDFLALFPELTLTSSDIRVQPQSGSTLGHKMKNAIDACLEMGCEKVLLFGSDIPTLGSSDLRSALELLDHHEVVITPTEDGGYCLLGMTKPYAPIFDLPRFGDSTVFENTLKSLPPHKRPGILPIKRDLDTLEDLKYFYTLYQNQPPLQLSYLYTRMKEVFHERIT